MTTGDLRGCLRKLEHHLRSLKYPSEVDYAGLAKGDPSSFLPVVNYAFLSYSSYLTEDLIGFGVELAGKNDLRFIEAVFKVLRDLFNYKPLLTKEQFLQYGFAERKIGILCEIISFVTERHKKLSKNDKTKVKPRLPRFSPLAAAEDPALEAGASKPTILEKPLVERHTACTVPVVSFSDELSFADWEDEEKDEDEDSLEPVASSVERRLQAMEAQVMEYQRKLETLPLLEDRLKRLEEEMAGKIVINRQDWLNLESRVLLLETRLMLNSAQKPLSLACDTESAAQENSTTLESDAEATPAPHSPTRRPSQRRQAASHPPSAATINPFVLTAVPKECIKERLERIASMMSDTSSLLRSTEPPM